MGATLQEGDWPRWLFASWIKKHVMPRQRKLHKRCKCLKQPAWCGAFSAYLGIMSLIRSFDENMGNTAMWQSITCLSGLRAGLDFIYLLLGLCREVCTADESADKE